MYLKVKFVAVSFVCSWKKLNFVDALGSVCVFKVSVEKVQYKIYCMRKMISPWTTKLGLQYLLQLHLVDSISYVVWSISNISISSTQKSTIERIKNGKTLK